jgi:hypothetical protein
MNAPTYPEAVHRADAIPTIKRMPAVPLLLVRPSIGPLNVCAADLGPAVLVGHHLLAVAAHGGLVVLDLPCVRGQRTDLAEQLVVAPGVLDLSVGGRALVDPQKLLVGDHARERFEDSRLDRLRLGDALGEDAQQPPLLAGLDRSLERRRR